ncbi:MAG TPA: DUF885 family protein [Opitutaceae bacterium]|nr:DUF885 family protein [Opitutaceae bacterium]
MRPALVLLPVILAASGAAQLPPSPAASRSTADYVPPEISGMTRPQSSELRELVERFVADRDELVRFYSVNGSALRRRRLREFYAAWSGRLDAMAYDSLGTEGRVDWLLMMRQLDYSWKLLDREEAREREMAPLIPFAGDIARLQESRRLMEPVDPQGAAATLGRISKEVADTQDGLQAGLKGEGPAMPKASKTVEPMTAAPVAAFRAVAAIGELRESLGDWFKFYDGYDPAFGWWARASRDRLNEALDGYVKFLREKIVGVEPGKDEPIIGDPIGRDGLDAELAHEMIAYSPEELLAIANRELAWCDAELRKASAEMGFGDNWKAAMEKVKEDHLPPGGQPGLIRDLALEAIKFVQDKDLVTIPPLAADFWRIEMIGPARQKVAPFFLGGPDILVAFPTDAMDYDDKVQSLRANNVHFARATVFHELVPGHHLQYYYEGRFNPHRTLFTTPFWVEGWAVWWEFQFWDLGFPRSPEDRMGMLFWRAHRCARIIFSLNFHLGKWTPQQCVDFLVDRVGHERASATGEVRRSFNGTFPPMYQAGYMLGALQLRELHGELVRAGGMTNRQFHDAILLGGPMPIELVRVRLNGGKPPRDFKPQWRFAD